MVTLRWDVKGFTHTHMTEFFGPYMPIAWGVGWLVPPLLLACSIVLFRQGQKVWGLAILVGLGVMIAAFGLNRVHVGEGNLLYSVSRMFLGRGG